MSNGLCSLNQDEDKLTLPCVFEMGIVREKWKKHWNWIVDGVVRSYSLRSCVCHDNASGNILDNQSRDFFQELTLLNWKLAKKIRKRRFDHGAVQFWNSRGKFKNLGRKLWPNHLDYMWERKDIPPKLIEEFMLLANKYVAWIIFNKNKAKRPLSYIGPTIPPMIWSG